MQTVTNEYTLKLIEAINKGELDPHDVLLNLLESFSDSSIESFIQNEYGEFINEVCHDTRESCPDCGTAITWFIHSCTGAGREVRGCKFCDYSCDYCKG